ncbi:PAS domain S-box protein [Sulfuriflexus mobilis]|uniref:PAS domain S-box protein n=1 Tax=Sulfuriflexus mobilis TaxID=1811807 RepID=UPI000F83BD83|nr:PAS domain S-box protein [Sulfuriflexus mobilis]
MTGNHTIKPASEEIQRQDTVDEEALLDERVRILFAQAPLALLGSMLCAFVVTYFLLGKADTQTLLVWCGVLLLLTLIRYTQTAVFRAVSPQPVRKHWLTLFEVGAALSGLTWGALALFAFPSGLILYQGFIAVVIGGLGAASVMVYAMSRYAGQAFILLSLGPVAVRFLLEGSAPATSLGLLVAFTVIASIYISGRVHHSLLSTLLLSRKNLKLAEQLTRSKEDAERFSQRLLEENKARKKIEATALEAEARFRNLSDAAFEGIIIHNEGQVLDINFAMADMVGFDQSELIGHSVLELVAPESRALVIEKLSHPDEKAFEVIGLRANGERFPAEVCGRDYPYRGKRVRVSAIRDISHERQAEHSLYKYEQHMRLLVEKTPLAVIEWDADFRVREWNPSAEHIFGYTRNEVLGRHAIELIIPNHVVELVDSIWRQITRGEGGERSTNDNKTKSGEIIICEWYNTPLIDSNGDLDGVVSLASDITERVQAQEALFNEKEFAETTLASIGDGVITTDEKGNLTYLNPVAEALTGWSLDEAEGNTLYKIYQVTDEFGHRLSVDPVQRCMENAERIETNQNLSLQNRDGRRFPIVHTISPIFDTNGVVIGSVLVIRDISELKLLENQLVYQASHDPLTGLVNRHEFELRVERSIALASAENMRHVLMYLDLDQFKVVNDTCGHIAGDELLKQISTQLHRHLRDTDTLARLGGDEFGVLLEGCPIEKGENIAEVLRETIRDYRFVWQDKTFEIGVSIGLVAITAEGGSLTDIMSAADSACYVAKDLGRNRSHIYLESDDILAARHGEMRWVQRISEAIADDRLVLYAQKIESLDAANNELHFEVLVRMLDEEGNIIPPGAFIPAAERYNLMSNIDRWVIRNALQNIDTVLADNPELDFVCALNISGQSLGDDDFLDFVMQQINLSRVESTSICFEITETAAIANLNQAMHIIDTLHGIGFRFSLDDFGSGLSSFAYLKNLKVDYLKIDGGFVRNIIEEPVNSAMVEAINKIGHVMEIKTIAEFVEDRIVRNYLRGIGVDYAQGYGIQRPIPLMEIFEND